MRAKIVVATPWPIWPLVDGRRTKAFARCLAWSSVADVEIVSAGTSATDTGEFALARGIVERRVPFVFDRAGLETNPFTTAGQRSVFFPVYALANVEYGRRLRAAAESAQGIVACTPFTYRAVRENTHVPVLLDAQAAEVTAVHDIFADDALAVHARRLVAQIEDEALDGADVVLRASGVDAPFAAVPTLFRSTDVLPDPQARRSLKERSNFAGAPLVLFAGSHTRGNQASIEILIRLAGRLPGLRFLAIGSIVEGIRGRVLPPNLGFTGVIDDAQFSAALTFADIGIEFGSAVFPASAKIDAYVRCGTPIIADRAIAAGSGLAEDAFVAATEASALDAVKDLIDRPDVAGQLAARAFRSFYERARTRGEIAALEALRSRV